MRKKERAMRKWKIWLAALLVLAISGGIFAYTALTGTSTITVSGGGTEYATVTPVGYSWSTKPVGGGQIGGVETGTLYTVARDSDYTGDLVFTLTLTNTDELVSNYVYLNIEIQVSDNVSAEVTTEWITLEEAAVELVVPAAKSSPFTVKVTDGTYRTEKGVDPTTSPVFHIRVRQK